MNHDWPSDLFATVSVVVLLLLTAWGNAYVMLGVAATALILMLLALRRRRGKGAPLAGAVGSATAVFIATVRCLQ